MMDQFKIFLSYKHHDKDGAITRDHELTQIIYKKCQDLGLPAFFSDRSIQEIGSSRYKQLIDDALDSSTLMIVICTNVEFVQSEWVHYEWDSYFNDILSGIKPGSELVTLTEGIKTSDMPRTLRNLQSFPVEESGIERLIEFIKGHFKLKTETPHSTESTISGSSYDYSYGNEQKRLEIQAFLEARVDVKLIPKLVESIGRKKLSVLDLGCSGGFVTRLLFSDPDQFGTVIGIDKFESCIKDFNHDSVNGMKGYTYDLESITFSDDLETIRKENNIDKFDIIYSSLCFHHLNSPKRVLKNLRPFLKQDGYIVIRTCDDGQDVFHPDPKGLIRQVLDRSEAPPGMSNRHNGREMPEILFKSGYKDIVRHDNSIDTLGKTPEERNIMFQNSFNWRKNYYRRYMDFADNKEQALSEYQWISEALDEIEDMYSDSLFYYCYITPTYVAKRTELLYEKKF